MKDDAPIHILWLPTVLAMGIAYIVSWIDLIPGIGIGWLDDIAVAIALIWFLTSWLPRNRHRIYWFRPRSQARTEAGSRNTREPAAPDSAVDFDPFEILKVAPDASPSEIKKAYREMLAKYHPDKVSHLGEEFQHMAHEKALDIKKAYEMLCGKG